MMHRLTFLLLCVLPPAAAAQGDRQGMYFAGRERAADSLPRFDSVRSLLPSPLFDEDPGLVRTYWKAWELAFRHFHTPAPGSGFAAQFIDAAFNDNIFLWDTAFMTMFCNIAGGLVPGIGSLDNFYVKQHETGEISREINRTTGVDFKPWINEERMPLFSRWGFNTGDRAVAIRYTGREVPWPPPALTLDALDNPVLSWAELESYAFTGDTARLRLVREPLVRYYRALQKFLRQGNGLYVTDWASMDNSPRNSFLLGGGTGIDISSQMVMFARQLAVIDSLTGSAGWESWEREADELSAQINTLMWDPERRFYFDLSVDGMRGRVKTIAAFWTLLGGVAGKEQSSALIAELRNPKTFARLHPVPSLSADNPDYVPWGGYWRGSVWPSTTTMVIRGLQRYGYGDLARAIAMKHVHAVAKVFASTGTIWENYAPDSIAPGQHVNRTPVVRDMVGWSGIGPILYFLEFGVGLKPDAPHNTLFWDIRSPRRSGCERFRFNGHTVTLVATPVPGMKGFRLAVKSDGAFTLSVTRGRTSRTVPIGPGATRLELPPE